MLCPVNTTARTHCLRSPKGCKRKAADAELETKDPKGRDQYAELFSRVEPRHIPESRAWWQRQQTELMSISDDSEYGLMTSMVTSTQNDLSPELLAHARRGPCAAPTDTPHVRISTKSQSARRKACKRPRGCGRSDAQLPTPAAGYVIKFP